MTNPRTEARRDHDRDIRKAEWRPGDPVPLHAESAPLSNAMDIVLLVRGMSNLQAAADLVDSYADCKASCQRLDAVAAGARP